MPAVVPPRKRLRHGAPVEPLPESNKGFQLLKSMGFTPGTALGKSRDGIKEPIAVEMKQNRLGLGAESKRAARREAQQRQADATAAETQREAIEAEHRLEAQGAYFRQRTQHHAAERRDEAGLRKALRACETLDGKAGVEMDPAWARALDAPGQAGALDADDPAAIAIEGDWEALPTKKKLSEAVDYLRSTHHYCIHCAVEYEDAQDMASNCPGPEEEDH